MRHLRVFRRDDRDPSLIAALPASGSQTFTAQNDYAALLRAAVESEGSFGGELAALRRAWARLLVEIGARDVAGEITLRESNQRQTRWLSPASKRGI